jgi:hypothetical protein
MSVILQTFTNHIQDFINDVERVFPDDKDIRRAKTAIETLKKANPRLLLLGWREHVTVKYGKTIMDGDISFFLEKDYSSDVEGDMTILHAIRRLREPIRNMGEENQNKVMKYLQNLTKLSTMYEG